MKKHFLCLIFFFLFIHLIISPNIAFAKPYFEGKVINIIVGYSPGGGFDRVARLFAKYLPNYIPGKPSVIVQNMPGASTIIASNYIYNIAKPDGLTIGSIERGLPIAQALKQEGVKFDLRKYSWIGSAASEPFVLYLRSDLPYKTFGDILKAKTPIIIGCSGSADIGAHFPLLLKEFLGLNIKLITYPGSAEIILAIERKEVDGRAGTYYGHRVYIERGLLRPFIRGRVSDPEIEKLPVDEDLTTDKLGKTLMAMRSLPDKLGRPYVAPPGTPTDIINILRDAFSKAANNPNLQADAQKTMLVIKYTPANECLNVLNSFFNQPENIFKELEKRITF